MGSPRSPQMQAALNSLAQRLISKETGIHLKRCLAKKSFRDLSQRVYGTDLVYVCNLAEEMGFQRALRVLEGVWQGVMLRWKGKTESLQSQFQEGRALVTSMPGFYNSFTITDPQTGDDSEVADMILKFLTVMPFREILCSLWLVSLLVDLDMDFTNWKAELVVEFLDDLAHEYQSVD